MAYHTHRDGGPVCAHPTKKACDEAYANWGAMQQVLLAYRIARSGKTQPFRKDKGVFAQLVLVIAGEAQDIVNGEGNPSQNAEVIRLRKAIQRVIAGDLPRYNLYTIPSLPEHGT